MSQRRPQPPKTHVPPPPSEDEDEEMDEMDDYDEGPDMFEALGSLLATEDGETITMIQLRQAEASEKIALQLEMQNKILVKILSEIKTSKIVVPPTAETNES
jgi:hypothetical protein